MKDFNLSASAIHQIIHVDCTKFGAMRLDFVDTVVAMAVKTMGESEFHTKSIIIVILPLLASDALHGTRGLEGERQRLYSKLEKKGLIVSAVTILGSTALLGNRSHRKTAFPCFLCVPAETHPVEGAKSATIKKEEKKVGATASQVNCFLDSELWIQADGDSRFKLKHVT